GEAILFVTPRERRMLRSIERVTNARLEEMELPTVDEVNAKRKENFASQITEVLGDGQMELFRGLVRKYSENNNVAMDDIAAALAVKLQGGSDFLVKDMPAPKRDRRERDRFERDDRGGRGRDRDRGRRDRDDRGGRHERRNDGDFDTYRLDVGKRQNVRPGAIVGAIANEGGLSAKDFGRITIAVGHTLVDLPKKMDPSVLDRLRDTRISGQLINIKKDTGRPPRDSEDRGGRGGSGGRDFRGGDRDGSGRGDRDRDRGGRGRWRDYVSLVAT